MCAACAAGLLNFTQENRGDKLWTPQDSVAQRQKEWVDKNFPAEVRISSVLLVGRDVLEPSSLREVIYNSFITSFTGETFLTGSCIKICGVLDYELRIAME